MTSDQPPFAAGDRTAHPAALDGNAAAGEFAGIFAAELTTVTVRCGNCGAARPFGGAHAYLGGPGTVLRCPDCEAVLARLARTPRGTWLDLSGSSAWLFPPQPE